MSIICYSTEKKDLIRKSLMNNNIYCGFVHGKSNDDSIQKSFIKTRIHLLSKSDETITLADIYYVTNNTTTFFTYNPFKSEKVTEIQDVVENYYYYCEKMLFMKQYCHKNELILHNMIDFSEDNKKQSKDNESSKVTKEYFGEFILFIFGILLTKYERNIQILDIENNVFESREFLYWIRRYFPSLRRIHMNSDFIPTDELYEIHNYLSSIEVELVTNRKLSEVTYPNSIVPKNHTQLPLDFFYYMDDEHTLEPEVQFTSNCYTENDDIISFVFFFHSLYENNMSSVYECYSKTAIMTILTDNSSPGTLLHFLSQFNKSVQGVYNIYDFCTTVFKEKVVFKVNFVKYTSLYRGLFAATVYGKLLIHGEVLSFVRTLNIGLSQNVIKVVNDHLYIKN